ncbi:MAG: flagellin [Desulfobulbaceae bacterium]|nr:flagellin [Desulfobulbaceae bacterium]
MKAINNTTPSLFTGNQLQKTEQNLLSILGKISSGKRLNQASDDAASLAIANSLGNQARGFGQSISNAYDAVAIAQIADGTLGQASELISSIRVQALQAANGSQSAQSRQALQADIDKSINQLDSLAKTTTYNGQSLLTGKFTDKNFQTGPDPGQTSTLSLGSIQPAQLGNQELGTMAEINVLSEQGAQNAVGIVDVALSQINAMRSDVGSRQNQLSSTIANLATTRINTMAAESTIRDLDFAEESTNLATMEILSKAQLFATTQANSNKKNVFNLLQGQF